MACGMRGDGNDWIGWTMVLLVGGIFDCPIFREGCLIFCDAGDWLLDILGCRRCCIGWTMVLLDSLAV